MSSLSLTFDCDWQDSGQGWSRLVCGPYDALAWTDGSWTVRAHRRVLVETESTPGLDLGAAKAAVAAWICADHEQRQVAA